MPLSARNRFFIAGRQPETILFCRREAARNGPFLAKSCLRALLRQKSRVFAFGPEHFLAFRQNHQFSAFLPEGKKKLGFMRSGVMSIRSYQMSIRSAEAGDFPLQPYTTLLVPAKMQETPVFAEVIKIAPAQMQKNQKYAGGKPCAAKVK